VILVDTSVWVEALRCAGSPEAAELRTLLDEDRVALAVPVRLEILAGASGRDFARLRRLLSALPLITPDPATWGLLESWVEIAVAAGQRFGFADLLIGALAAGRGSSVWSLDRDFARLADLGLISLHAHG
jgi:predicted nucleic acid-binding protein